MANIREVARRAGVGVGTVSRALNGSGYVAEETKERIQAIARELDYNPNELARNLFRNRTGIVGVVVPDMENPFFSKLLKYMEIELYKNSYKALICNTIEISSREQDFIDMLKANVVDGIITGAHSLQDDAYHNLNKPVVAMDRNLGSDIPVIHSDHKAGGRMAAELLLEAGCRNVLQFGGSFRVHTPSNDRHMEFCRVMEENGAAVNTIELAWNMMGYDYYRNVMNQYMDIYRNIDGVFTTDIVALYCMDMAKQRNIPVPEKLHIVGYDAIDVTRLFTPNLTSIAQNIPLLAKTCVDTMMDLLDGKKVEMEQILDVSVQRGGTV
ncbi:LacI family transcriptional regulator [Clostridiaceae bacterium]|nr:LacI family transcriptional regulator [Clostridiaceae bacterium]